ncbi:hypothetical protein GCM10009623_03790 [Nocardioides aestuarii]|uniref:Class I SAM-dependent methyltransferase n=1 Tax=Nocardioides aestuarii TaxID=252231 RepID=A0ABW4TGM5_9ACTN
MTPQADLAAWCFRCERCGTWGSDLPIGINDPDHPLDEPAREAGLRHVRARVGRQVLATVQDASPPGPRLLDIGSAHGWFVAMAAARGFDAAGIEPDAAVAGAAVTPTRLGYFPDDVDAGEEFDVITFNDVLEHVPAPRQVVASCRDHLAPGGILSINIPSSAGLLFGTAVVARRRGRATALFDRLWQVGLPSPHLWFFDLAGLSRLCDEEGFDLVAGQRLPTMSWRGLWGRAHMDRSPSPLTVAGVGAAALGAPVLNRGGDIMHLVLRRRP